MAVDYRRPHAAVEASRCGEPTRPDPAVMLTDLRRVGWRESLGGQTRDALSGGAVRLLIRG
jgi:hypothetical protein